MDIPRRRQTLAPVGWTVLLLTATALRLTAPDWDGGVAAHPDERFLLGVAEATPILGNVCAVAADFPYGHLPVRLARLIVLAAPGADPLYAARLLSGLVGVLIVAVTGAAGRRLAGRAAGARAALTAGAVATFAPFLIQQAHFYTVDPLATLFVTGAILVGTRRRWGITGTLLGLGMASKASVAVALVPLLIAALDMRWREPLSALWNRQRIKPALALLVGTLAAFVVAAPWAVLAPVACWRGPLVQSFMAAGRYDFPYTRQYAGTWPYVYPLVQMALWGLGPLTVAAALWGMVRGAVRGLRPRTRLAWWWTVIFFTVTGAAQVKFARYMLPLYPWLAAWAAYALWAPRQVGNRAWTGPRVALTAAVVGTTAVLGLAQVGLYGSPYSLVAASRWIYDEVAPGSTIAVETWEHPLPVDLAGQTAARYTQLTVPVYIDEDREKLNRLATAAEVADVVALASRRGYAALSRQPARYAATLRWYRELFAERELRVFARCPRLGPVAITDDPLADLGVTGLPSLAERCGTPYAVRLPQLDESFRVYDAPMVSLLEDKPGQD